MELTKSKVEMQMGEKPEYGEDGWVTHWRDDADLRHSGRGQDSNVGQGVERQGEGCQEED